MTINISRRTLLKGAGAGLLIGAVVPLGRTVAQAATVFEPNAFVRIAPDNTVTVLIKHIEFGQGPWTGLSTLVAEELDADWAQMRAEHAPADAALYANTLFGLQGTGGSTAMPNSFMQMRKAGAAARIMLVEAAAERWGVEPGAITVERGVVMGPGGETATFGELADAAAGRQAPADPPVKSPDQFRLIGTDLPKLDTPEKTTGAAIFTMDVKRPGMVVAAVAHPRVFGATVKSFDAAAALALPGVRKVEAVPTGVAVYADTTWHAFEGRRAVTVEWDTSTAETRTTAEIERAYEAALDADGIAAANRGDAAAALTAAGDVHEATFHFPFLAHAPMEPLDAVIEVTDAGVEAWMGSQLQTIDQLVIGEVFGLEPARVKIHTMLTGGSFGRRAQPGSPFAREAAEVAKAWGQPGAVKLVWSREDDITGGYYRPLTVHRLRGALDSNGGIAVWEQRIATQSLVKNTAFEMLMEGDLDPTTVEGARDLPYAIEHLYVAHHPMETKVPPLWWRSVGHTHTAYSTEMFVDELLDKAGRDPVEGRLALLAGADPRYAGVLSRVAELAGWSGSDAADGRKRGVAVHKSFGTFVAQIAEVSVGENGLPRVHKVWCAIDCGIPVNPNVIRAQMEGGIGFGLGAVLFDQVTLGEGGRVVQSNFHDYRSLRINEMPEVEVAVIASTEPPTGVGEPGVPPAAPAVANAWRRLTGQSVRRLPFVAATGA